MVDILLVEDNKELSSLMSKFFVRDGYSVYCAESGEEAIEFFNNEIAKLVILDIMLPKIDGFSVCSAIRKRGDVPIIIISAMVDKEDKMNGFNLGADDYIIKPFETKELVARVKAVLRRYHLPQTTVAPSENARCVTYPDLIVNLDNYSVTYDKKAVEMPPKELELLYFLASAPNQVFTREQLLDNIWGYDYIGDTRTVDVHIKRIREKIKDHDKWSIETVWGIGYKFVTK